MQKTRLHDSEYCLLCGETATDTHHCIGGANRQNSEAEGLTIRLCHSCHMELHNDHSGRLELLKRVAQTAFEYKHGDNGHSLWMERFGRNYL